MVFFSNALLTKDGKFASIWEAANMGMSKQMVCNPRKGNQSRKWANVKIATIVKMVGIEKGLALRLSSQLMSGAVRIYSFQFCKLVEKSRNVQAEFIKKQRNLTKSKIDLPKDMQTAKESMITMCDIAAMGDIDQEVFDSTQNGVMVDGTQDLLDLLDIDDSLFLVRLGTSDSITRQSISSAAKSNITLSEDFGLENQTNDELVDSFAGFGDGAADESNILMDDFSSGGDFGQQNENFDQNFSLDGIDDPTTNSQYGFQDDAFLASANDDTFSGVDKSERQACSASRSQVLDPAGDKDKADAEELSQARLGISEFISSNSRWKPAPGGRKRKAREVEIDAHRHGVNGTMISAEAMRDNMSTADELLVRTMAVIPTKSELKQRQRKKHRAYFHHPQRENECQAFLQMRQNLMSKSLEEGEQKEVDDIEQPRSQEQDEGGVGMSSELFGEEELWQGRSKSLNSRDSILPQPEDGLGGVEDSMSMFDQQNNGDDFGDLDLYNDDNLQQNSNFADVGFENDEPPQALSDSQLSGAGVYEATGSPVPSWRSLYSESEQSSSQMSSQSGTTPGVLELQNAALEMAQTEGGKRGLVVSEYIQSAWDSNEDTDGSLPSKLFAARMFHDVLYAVSKDLLEVKQTRAFGSIFVRPKQMAAAA